MKCSTVNRLILAGLMLVWAVIITTALALIHKPSPPPIDYCPPHDLAYPWCVR
jgi:hypothetical protein